MTDTTGYRFEPCSFLRHTIMHGAYIAGPPSAGVWECAANEPGAPPSGIHSASGTTTHSTGGSGISHQQGTHLILTWMLQMLCVKILSVWFICQHLFYKVCMAD